jgi:Tol biopolymer transport system component
MTDKAVEDTREETLRGLIPEDLMKFRWLEEIACSPDGQHVAYTVRQPDGARNDYQADVYLLELDTHTRHKLSNGIGQGGSLSWSRDGQRLAFVWRGVQETSVELVDADGSPRRSYPVDGPAPSGLDWSPDGRSLACSRWTQVRGANESCRRPGVPAPSVRVLRRLRYKQDGVGWVEDRFRHIWVLALDTGDWLQLTDGECDYSEPRWSWDGTRIAFSGMAREQNTTLGQGQILVCDYASGSIDRLMPEWQGVAASPQWRADDGAVAFTGHAEPPPVNRRRFSHVWLYELENGKSRDLTADLDQMVGNYAVADQRAGLANITVKWPGGQGRIYFLLTDQGATHLYSVTAAGAWRQELGGK